MKKMELTPLDKEIIQGMANHSMKVGAIAKELYLDTGTVYYHIKRVQAKTGLSPAVFRDLVELLERLESEEADAE